MEVNVCGNCKCVADRFCKLQELRQVGSHRAQSDLPAPPRAGHPTRLRPLCAAGLRVALEEVVNSMIEAVACVRDHRRRLYTLNLRRKLISAIDTVDSFPPARKCQRNVRC